MQGNHVAARRLSVICLSGLLLLGGCAAMIPPYERPAAPVPEAWPGSLNNPAGAAERDGADLPWQDFFIDQRLRQVIRLALDHNRDLRLAALAVERTQAQYQIQRAELLPAMDATAGGSGQGIPKDLSTSGAATTVEQYSVGLGVTAYEVDLFGRVRSLKEQALEQYLASHEARRAVQISLISQVAAAHLTLAADRDRLRLARETLAAHEESLHLMERRLALGVASELDLRQAQTRVEAARLDIARYTTLAAQDENALQLLTGAPLPAELLPPALAEGLTALRDLSPGLPSEVLLQRPDVMQAEHQLKAMQANIGAARAAFLPRITLVGALGTGSDELSGLFAAGSLAWTFTPRLSLPIFDGGANQAKLRVAEVDRQMAVARYEKGIQTAFREVADALGQRATQDSQMAAQQSLVEAATATYRLAQARYEQGLDSYLSVLDAQRTLYGAQQGMIAIRQARLLNLLSLYKALGGGASTGDGAEGGHESR